MNRRNRRHGRHRAGGNPHGPHRHEKGRQGGAHRGGGTHSRQGPPKQAQPSHGHPSGGRAPQTVEGQFVLKGKFGFVLSEKSGVPDVYVQGDSLRLAMNGDRVVARLQPARDRSKLEGEILRVTRRARRTAVGIFRRVRGVPLLVPEDGAESIRILDLKGRSPKEGELAVVEITEWPTAKDWAGGALIEEIGLRASPEVDLKAHLRKFELPEEFPPAVQAEAEAFGTTVPEAARRGRETFFHIPVFTIDGADAKDFDDAVSLEPRPGGGWRLGVHIADVAHYVREGSLLDEEAYQRATSVYLVGSVVPMLPFALSDILCSLRPDEDRLTLSCLMDLDGQGRVVSRRIVEGVIRSGKRFTYEEVEEILRGRWVGALPSGVETAVKEMGKVARILREARFRRGSLDFDFPEPYVVSGPDGWPVDVRRRERLESHRLIEEFMLLANETVATAMRKFPFLYRIHERPDPEKLGRLEATLKAVGVTVPPGFHDGRPAALQKVLTSVKGSPLEPMVHMMVLRSLKQAVYSPVNGGHYGLASSCYTHFTSPIRRYPDLIVHRIVKEHLHGRLTPDRQAEWKESLTSAAAWTSQRERAAVEAEREFLEWKRVQVMEKRVGESFEGVVTGVTPFGFFVQLKEIFVEGLVHVSNLRDDYYIFDEVRSTLRGRRSGRIFRMGLPVRVRLAAANLLKRQLDFELETVLPEGGHSPRRR